MKRILAIVALLWALGASALGPNGTLGTITVVNANGTTGACTAASCVLQAYQQNFAGGTIFTGADAKYSTASLQLTGTWVGTITFQFSQDEGATWNTTYCYLAPLALGSGPVSASTANGNWMCPVTGTTTLRAVATAWTSGTATVALEAFTTPAFTQPPPSQGTLVLPCNVGASAPCASGVGGTVIQVKATGGQLFCLDIINTLAAVGYVQVFALPAASVTLGTTTPYLSIGLAVNGTKSICFPGGIQMASGISIAGTTTPTGSTGAVSNVNVIYQ